MKKAREKSQNVVCIEPRAFYAYTKNLSEGLGLLIVEKEGEVVFGLKMKPGKIQKFRSSVETIKSLMAYGVIEFTEKIPNDVWKEMNEIYKNIN